MDRGKESWTGDGWREKRKSQDINVGKILIPVKHNLSAWFSTIVLKLFFRSITPGYYP